MRRRLAGAPMRLVLLFLAVAAGCAASGDAAVGGASGPGPAPPELPMGTGAIEVLGTVDYSWTVRSAEGAVLPLERFRGRPLFLNVWATWCPPCVAELGSIRDLMTSLDTARVGFLLVSPEELDTVRPFLERLGYPLPAAVEDTRMPESWGVRALPTTVVVDARGRIVLRHRGAADWDQESVRAFLTRLAEAR